MAIITCPECKKAVSDSAISCPNCGYPLTKNVSQSQMAVQSEEQEGSIKDIINYLKYAAMLEQTVYTYERTSDRLFDKICSLGHKREIPKPDPQNTALSFRAALGGALFAFGGVFIVSLIICCVFGGHFWSDLISVLTVILIFFNRSLLGRVGTALLIAFGVASAVAIVGVVKVAADANTRQKNYAGAVQADKERVAREEKMSDKLTDEMVEVDGRVNENKELLKKLYGLNVIHPKYQNMIAVTTMLEYLESGRCLSLTGPHGAYDTYSYEEKKNIIIGRLDTVISMLDEIRQTQRALYDAIQESNAIAADICGQAQRIAEANRNIADNTALIAYNTSVIRQNTEISAYIDMYNFA